MNNEANNVRSHIVLIRKILIIHIFEVFIKPASHGTGVVAGGAMRAVLESVGITDVLAKSKGSSNPHNLVKATIEALSEMRDARMVAQNRGISVEKVFRG